MKAADLLNKLAGLGLLCISVLSMIGFMNSAEGRFMIPAVLLGSTGIWLLTRRPKETPSPDLLARVERLEAAIAAAQQELGAAQTELKQLSEERDFYRELHAPPAEQARRDLPSRISGAV